MIVTGTATILIPTLTKDNEGYVTADYSNPQKITNIPADFQNKPSGEIQFSDYGLNDIQDNKYIFTESLEFQCNRRVINDKTSKVYEIVKIFDGYSDGHLEVMVRPVQGE